MAAIIFIVILIFIIAIQAFLPKFLKESEAFGIYIPDTHVKDQRIVHMKSLYTTHFDEWNRHTRDFYRMAMDVPSC